MQMTDEVLNALQTLKDNAENDFERHRINVLEMDLTNPPRVEVIDDKHQRFNGVTFRKRHEGHYFTPSLSIYHAVWIYHYGEVPPNTVIHHIDHNKSNNNIENLIPMLPAAHRKHHGGAGEKIEVTLICQDCGNSYTTKYHGQKIFRCPDCQRKHKRTHTKIYEKTCEWCGKSFETKQKNTQCCSPSCAQRLVYFKRTGQNAALIDRVCVVCGKTFKVSKSHRGKENYDRITCSDECLSKYRGMIHKPKTPKICAVCGKEFYPKGHHSNDTKTCSPECAYKLRYPNAEYITTKCELCGKEITALKSAKRRFCSQECLLKYMAQVNTKRSADSTRVE